MWSTGCVLVEMINGTPPFLGDSQIDQLIEIIKVLGTPSKEDVLEMNKNYNMKEYSKFPIVKAVEWKNILQTKDEVLVDLVGKIMQYSPKKRYTPA
jgi:glycogen synthase kinase 3 beta